MTSGLLSAVAGALSCFTESSVQGARERGAMPPEELLPRDRDGSYTAPRCARRRGCRPQPQPQPQAPTAHAAAPSTRALCGCHSPGSASHAALSERARRRPAMAPRERAQAASSADACPALQRCSDAARRPLCPETSRRCRRLNISLADFDILGRAGDGSFSTVILARHKASGVDYAIKMINKSVVMRNKIVDYIKNERNILDKLSHEGIVQLKFTFQDEDSLCERPGLRPLLPPPLLPGQQPARTPPPARPARRPAPGAPAPSACSRPHAAFFARSC
jgi:hypothetical protein